MKDRLAFRSLICSWLVLTGVLGVARLAPAAGFRPGDVYREYRQIMRKNTDWRVTDPQAKHGGARKFLPNPMLRVSIDDLNGAIRAEAILDRWGGHPGTTNKRIRFNGNAWIDLPELTTTPDGARPELFMSHDNPVVDVPLNHLHEGENQFEGTCGEQIDGFNWGQWGWTGIVLRVYYDAASKPHPRGRLISPRPGDTLDENPVVVVDAVANEGVERVDILAHYEGYDEDGDGVFGGWHRMYLYNRKQDPGPVAPALNFHVGSAESAPFRIEWDTRWVPDQPRGSLKLVARILGKNGLWFVTDVVNNLALLRPNASVKLYKPLEVPPKYWVRAGRRQSSLSRISPGDNLGAATEAAVHIRTWNGVNEEFWINGYPRPIIGGDHIFSYAAHEIPLSALKSGTNLVEFFSSTDHHGVEILWPGPALTVRYETVPSRESRSAAP